MRIINRYIAREVLKTFSLMLVMVVGIYLAVDFFEKIDDFMEAGLPISRAMAFFAYKVPFILAQIIPISALLAVLVVFGLMNRRNEIIALQSSGVSVYALLKPAMAVGLFCFVLMIAISEGVVPVVTERANQIWLGEVRNERVTVSKEKNIWIKGHRRITHINLFHPPSGTISGLTLSDFDGAFHLSRRIDARTCVFENGQWVLHDFMEQIRQPDGSYRTTFHKQRPLAFSVRPEALTRVVKRSEEMGFRELLRYIRKVEDEGYAATSYRVDLWAKIAFPFICIILCLVGAGIAVKTTRHDGMPLSIAYGIGVAFLYWVFYSFCLSLGYGEILPPAVAALSPNLVFLCLGIFTLSHAE
ncbi:MAG: LPS export ABC transporter permease LptG [Desulfobacterales bacterium]|nr:LPS export ABC transporter permease LptG [Desulfobacterales bacterium]